MFTPSLAAVLLGIVAAVTLPAQIRLTLEQAGSRLAPDWAPAYDGKDVLVTGQVSSRPLPTSESLYLPIQDTVNHGLLIEGSERQFRDLAPGDLVEAQGTISRHAGLPVLLARSIKRSGHAAAPVAKVMKLAEAASLRYTGVLVTTESTVTQEKANTISIGERGIALDVVMPRGQNDSEQPPNGLHAGDRIRVTGVASQYCPVPPYDRYFQILLPNAASITVVEKAWMIPPPLLLASVMLAAALLVVWWFRERRMVALRRRMRVLNTLGEEVIGSKSPSEIVRAWN